MGDNGYEEYEDYGKAYKEQMIGQFMREGFACIKGYQFWIENEKKENEKRLMSYKTEKSKNAVGVAFDHQTSRATSQWGGCSTSSEAKWSPDSPLLIEPLTWRSVSKSYEVPVPFHWFSHPTKKRTAGTNVYSGVQHDQDRTKKGQNIKGKNVVDVIADEGPFTSKKQHDCSSSSDTNLFADASLLMLLSVRRTSSTYYKASVPLPNWGHHTTITTTKENTFMEMKTRTTMISDNMGQEQRRKKCQHMEIRAKEKHPQPREKRKKKKAKMERKSLSHIQPPPPPGGMPINLHEAITELGGTTPVWLMEKRKLTITDTKANEGRLFIPSNGNVLLEEYLTAEEKEKLLNPTEESNRLKVMVVDTSGEQFDIDLRIWKSFNRHVFARNWNRMVKQLRMQAESDTIQIWFFRLSAIC